MISILGYKGDYVEKRIVATHEDMVVIIYYSINHPDKPIYNGINRGISYIGVTMIKLVNDRTEITMYSQTNPNSTLGKLFSNLAVTRMGA